MIWPEWDYYPDASEGLVHAFDDQEKYQASQQWVQALVDELYGDIDAERLQDIMEELAHQYDVRIPASSIKIKKI